MLVTLTMTVWVQELVVLHAKLQENARTETGTNVLKTVTVSLIPKRVF